MAASLGEGPDWQKRWDVLVVGGGNAALCAAISARRAKVEQGPER